MKMGLREANQKFSAAIRAIRNNNEVVLTERGKPFAVIKPIDLESGEESKINNLENAGILRGSDIKKPLPPCKPVHIAGEPVSITISRERD